MSLQVCFGRTPQPRNVTFWQSIPAVENQFQYCSVRTGLIRSWIHSQSGLLRHNIVPKFLHALYQAKSIILEKTLEQNYSIDIFDGLRTKQGSNLKTLSWETNVGIAGLCGTQQFCYNHLKQELIYKVWWVFYPGDIFLVELYHKTLGPWVSMGSYPFPFRIKLF